MPWRHGLCNFSELARQIVETAANVCVRAPGAIVRNHAPSGAAPPKPSGDAESSGLVRLYAASTESSQRRLAEKNLCACALMCASGVRLHTCAPVSAAMRWSAVPVLLLRAAS